MHVEYEQRGQLGRGYHPAPIHSLNGGYHQMADGRLMTGSTHGPGSEYVTGGGGGFIGPPLPAYMREGVPSEGGGWVSVDPPNMYVIPPPAPPGSEESGTGGGWSTGRSLNEILGPGTYLPGGVFEPGYVPIPRIPADAPRVGYDGIPYGERRARGLSQPHEVDVSFGPTFGYPDWMEDTEGEPARVGLGWRILW